MRILHVGNDFSGQGGVASVIRAHLARPMEAEVTAIASYSQDQVGVLKHAVAAKALWTLLRQAPNPSLVLHFHVSQRGSLLREGMLLYAGWLRGHRAMVVTLHGSSLGNAGRARARLVRLALRPARVVHVLSAAHASVLEVGRRGRVIPNDVRIPSDVKPMSVREPLIVFAGELSRRKGVDVLIEAWRRSDKGHWTLSLAGPRPKSEAQRVSLEDLPDGAQLLGAIKHDDLLALLGRASVLVLPSRAEALPMAVCEAMAAGCAVIATDVGGVSDLLKDSAFLLPEANIDLLEEAISELIVNPITRQDESNRNRHRAEEYLASGAVTQQWVDLYQSLGYR